MPAAETRQNESVTVCMDGCRVVCRNESVTVCIDGCRVVCRTAVTRAVMLRHVDCSPMLLVLWASVVISPHVRYATLITASL